MPLDLTDINSIVSFVVKEAKLPEWQTKLFKKYRDEIQVHSKGELFYKINRLFPNEHEASKEHRLLAFEAVTKGSFWKGINNVNTVFTNSSYTVEASENTVAYIQQNVFCKKNLFSFFLTKWCDAALAYDPNSLVVVYPFEYMKINPEMDQVQIVGSQHIITPDRSDIVAFLSEIESDVDYDFSTPASCYETFYDQTIERHNQRLIKHAEKTYNYKLEAKIKRKVWHVFTKDSFIRIEQKDNGGNGYDYTVYPVGKNFIPCVKVGGLSMGTPKVELYESFFSVFLPFGNLALLQHSQHTAVNFIFSFPRMSEQQAPCDAQGCEGGKILCKKSEENPDGKKPCRACNGTGYKVNQTPYKVYVKKFDPKGLDQEGQVAAALKSPMVEYYTPDVAILDYSKKEWRDYLESAEEAVYVPQKVETGNVESAKSKEYDRQDRYNFLARIGNIFYDRCRFVIQCFENYLNAAPMDVIVNNPYSYAITTEQEAFDALNTILKSDAPVLIKANQVEAFINKFVSQSSAVKKAFDILKKMDLLLFYSDAQLISAKASGIVTGEQLSTHLFAFPVLLQLYCKDNNLFELTEDAIIAKLEKELEQYKPEETSLTDNLLNQLNTTVQTSAEKTALLNEAK